MKPAMPCHMLFEDSLAVDADSIARGTPALILMEQAGLQAALYLKQHRPDPNTAIVILCGAGNNGGDGYCMARHLRAHGYHRVQILAMATPHGETANWNHRQYLASGGTIHALSETIDSINRCDILVDAILGAGAQRPLPVGIIAAIDRLIQCHQPHCIALDIPTGIHARCGAKTGDWFFPADETYGFGCWKPAYILQPGKSACGKVTIFSLTWHMPPDSVGGIRAHILNRTDVTTALPHPSGGAHKYQRGSFYGIIGREPYAGAGILAAHAAHTTGVGMCCVATSPATAAALHMLAPEIITHPFDDTAPPSFKPASPSAILIGCGLGELPPASVTMLLESLIHQHAGTPLVFDADGLRFWRTHPDAMRQLGQICPILITPHGGEALRLLPELATEKTALHKAARLAQTLQCHVILKDSGANIYSSPDGDLIASPFGTIALAKGGSGDILAGLVAGFWAQGIPPRDAAILAMGIQGMIADASTARGESPLTLTPSRLLAKIPDTITHLCS